MRFNSETKPPSSRRDEGAPQQRRQGRWAVIRRQPRVILLGLLILAVFAGFTQQLWQLQFLEGDRYRARAERQSTRRVTVPAPRGIIYDRNGAPLVRNVPGFYVSVVPAYLPDDQDDSDSDVLGDEAQSVLIRLAMLLDVPYEAAQGEDGSEPGLREKVEEAIKSGAIYRPLVVERAVEREKALLVAQESTDLPGVSVEAESVRDYPHGPVLSHVLGYLLPVSDDEELREEGYDPATDLIGFAGIEKTYEEMLRGEKGRQMVEEDVLGRVIRVVEERAAPVPGHNVYLTLDLDLQRAVEEALQHGMSSQNVNAPRGAAIVMNPQTGEILAMVSLPTYDNNVFVQGVTERDLERWDDPHRPLLNHAISDGVPPGSVFKIVMASAALQEGVLTPRTHLSCPGKVVVPNKYYPNDPGQAQPFYCWNRAGHGSLDVVGAIANSCNIFFYKVGGGFEETEFDGLGVARIAEYARLFGFGKATGVELPAEGGGLVPTSEWKRHTYGESWSTGDTYNLSIGEGYLEVTPLQMLNAVNAIANGGKLYRPTVVHHITDPEGNVTRGFEPEIIRTLPISREYLSLVRQGMEGAVAYGTAARRGQIEGLRIAGKTGTAQYCDDIAAAAGLCAETWPEHAWFTAFAPVDEPEVSVIVFLYEGGEGSVTAVPIARDILAYYFQIDDTGDDATS